jgi:hypothetical protein
VSDRSQMIRLPNLCAICAAAFMAFGTGAQTSTAASSQAEEKIRVPTGTGRIHATGTASLRKPDGTFEKLIGVFIEGIRPDVIKGKDVMLYFSDTSEFQWLLSAEGKVISYECLAAPVLEKGKSKLRIFLYGDATVKEEASPPPDRTSVGAVP